MKVSTAAVSLTSTSCVEWGWPDSVEHFAAVSVTDARLISDRASDAPRFASLMLVARPIPLPAPVMRMTRFEKRVVSVIVIGKW